MPPAPASDCRPRRLEPHPLRRWFLRCFLLLSSYVFVAFVALALVGCLHEFHTGWVTETAEHGVHRRDAWGIDVSYCLGVAREVFVERGLSEVQTSLLRWDVEHHERNDETPSAIARDDHRLGRFFFDRRTSQWESHTTQTLTLILPLPVMIVLSGAGPVGWATVRVMKRRRWIPRAGSPRPLGRRMAAVAVASFVLFLVTVIGWIYTEFGWAYAQWARQVTPAESQTYWIAQGQAAEGMFSVAVDRVIVDNQLPIAEPQTTAVARLEGIPAIYLHNWRESDSWWGRAGFAWEFSRHSDGAIVWHASAPLWFLGLVFVLIPLFWLARKRGWVGRRSAGHCPRCGYDTRATPNRCPECGFALHELRSSSIVEAS